MIEAIGKYTDVRAAAERPAAPHRANQVRGGDGRGPGIPVMGQADRMPWAGAEGRGQKAEVRRQRSEGSPNVRTTGAPGAGTRPTGMQILVPQRKAMIDCGEWMWKELREGGFFYDYLRRERYLRGRRHRAIGRRMQHFSTKEQAKNKADWELKATVPAREFFRWKQEDPDFWRDDSNLRSLKRDNPDMCIYNVGARKTKEQKKY